MSRLLLGGLVVVCGLAALPSCAPPPGAASDARAAVAAVLDALHDAASRADGETYFACFEADAVFLGTDATERWPLAEFRAYAAERFATGTGWTYQVRERHTFLDEARHTAWFDERLDNAKYGECRGTGVLVLREGRWRIAQYNLAIPIPNDIALDMVEMIRRSP
jgi:hypothetical protein